MDGCTNDSPEEKYKIMLLIGIKLNCYVQCMKLTVDSNDVFCKLPISNFETDLDKHLPCGLASISSPPLEQQLFVSRTPFHFL